MTKPSLRLQKVWEDDYSLELNLSFISPHCQSNLSFYTTTEELDKLKQGFLSLSDFIQNEIIWISGEDENKEIAHYVYIRSFIHNKQGHIGIEILLDNKLTVPKKMRSHSFVLTEINQLDEFIRQLDSLIKGEKEIVEGMIPYSY